MPDPWQQGYVAYQHDVPLVDNPYSHESEEFYRWKEGWKDAWYRKLKEEPGL